MTGQKPGLHSVSPDYITQVISKPNWRSTNHPCSATQRRDLSVVSAPLLAALFCVDQTSILSSAEDHSAGMIRMQSEPTLPGRGSGVYGN